MNNRSLKNVLNKTVSTTATYDAQMVTAIDDKQIVVRVALPYGAVNWKAINYMEVDGAYYYIDSVKHIANGLSEINGSIDLLMTYRDAIKQLTVLAERSTSHGSPLIADPLRASEAGAEVKVSSFTSSIGEAESTGTYILSTSQNGYKQ
jgi:hypothetical protein